MSQLNNLLIVDDDGALVRVFEKVATERGWSYVCARSGTEALEKISTQSFEVGVVDLMLPGLSGIQVLDYIKQHNIPTEIVLITGVGSIESAVDAIKKGAYDYLTKPFDDIERVAIVLDKAMERFRLMRKLSELERFTSDRSSYEGIIGKSRRMQEVYSTVDAIAPTTSTVLIFGESGTGKELIARAIHQRSPRNKMPFVVINCAAIPEHLMESELFGHKKGSFTGALSDKKGLFEEADGGTVFLDEIGEIPPSIQVKLLRVLQEGEVRSVGENVSRKVDVRIIAATNRNLSDAVKEGRFREDLYYRLNVIAVSLPPLRERSDDIPILSYHFLSKFSQRMEKRVNKISIDALQALQNYTWVGNVRELENVIERAVVLAAGDTLMAYELPPRLLGESFYLTGGDDRVDMGSMEYVAARERALGAFNRMYISNLLVQTSGNITFAAERAGMDRSNFKKLIRRYKIEVSQFKKSRRRERV